MKRLLALLTSAIFFIISQAGVIHAMDMRIMHNDTAMVHSRLFTPKVDIFCSKNLSANEPSCFQEIPESKWIASGSYKILEIFQMMFFLSFVLYSILTLILRNESFLRLKHILGPPKDAYASLFGIIRNNN